MQFSLSFRYYLFLGPSNFLSAIFLNTLSYVLPWNLETNFYTGIKQEDTLHCSFCNNISPDIRQTSYINFTLLIQSKVRVSSALDKTTNVCNGTKFLMSL